MWRNGLDSREVRMWSGGREESRKGRGRGRKGEEEGGAEGNGGIKGPEGRREGEGRKSWDRREVGVGPHHVAVVKKGTRITPQTKKRDPRGGGFQKNQAHTRKPGRSEKARHV